MGERVGGKDTMYAIGLIGTITVILILLGKSHSILFNVLAIVLINLIEIIIFAIGGTLCWIIATKPKMVLQFLGLPTHLLFQGITTGLGIGMFILEIYLYLNVLDKTIGHFD